MPQALRSAHGVPGGAGCSDLDCRDRRVLAAEDVRGDRGGSLDLLRHPRSRFMLPSLGDARGGVRPSLATPEKGRGMRRLYLLLAVALIAASLEIGRASCRERV